MTDKHASSAHNQQGHEEPHVVVRDRRRIDPKTGQVRPSSSGNMSEDEGADKPKATDAQPSGDTTSEQDNGKHELRAQLDERTADLQRLTAEYANYRKRVERDREVATVNAKAALTSQLLTVLDDVERAAAHDDLNGAFKSVADKLVSILQQAGLESFAHEGESFDPAVHEAVQHDTSSDVAGPTVSAVLRRGYRFGDRTLRPALVSVTDHEPTAPVEQSTEEPEPSVVTEETDQS